MNEPVPTWMLRELGRADGGARTLGALVDGQHARRLLLLRLLLDAVRTAPATVLPPAAAALAHEHWTLLEDVDRAAPEAARAALYYPLAGPWAERCVRGLTGPPPLSPAQQPPPPAGAGRPGQPAVAADLAHLGGFAVAAAARGGRTFRTRLAVRAGQVTLPALGALRVRPAAPSAPPPRGEPPPAGRRGAGPAPHPARPGPYAAAGNTVWVRGAEGVLTVSGAGIAPAVLRPDGRGGWRSDDPRWRPVHALADGPVRILLDDADPYRAVDDEARQHGLFDFGTLTVGQRERWHATWRAALPLLTLTGQRPLVDAGLLSCVIPMTRPPGAARRADGAAHSSGTRREAFGAVLASAPGGPATLAATLVHELHHAKLAAVSDLTPLHTAGPPRRYWAPWRPDARPFDGLLHGAYAHLALADYWQRVALAPVDPELRDLAWAEHARCREQVGAILPTLSGSRQLTSAGRVLLEELVALHTRMKGTPPPARYLARAAAYVETARLTWRRQHTR
ncbi:HEXXH motif-containing putative peptide modification protein [Streptomyces sp. 71268]|uniref:aKG-HExxH-type peptide beta-hydroxylase n=1 Tax=Streptomyces sp. 71268 TaxID=3002640 RepID=UPI0023F63EC7|nr:HEXXH motif-containing putative peptide modification protein [Streptomyces sp. 71268]WEV25413.1 HEXXH motif-containing putative peptide modification protein [Streptomyces sp. 71268]